MGILKKILIANRGEIAVRVIRTAKEMGIETVSIFAEDDRQSQHVSLADEAVLLPGTRLHETYLNQDLIIQVAKEKGAEAIHPGYGFLSENAGFAQKVEQAGLIFIGASPSQIELMGEKNRANDFAQSIGIPVIPRIKGSASDILDLSVNMEFPLLVKASAGGGGKGMLVVDKLSELPQALKQAARQAGEYFGNDEVFAEKYLPDVRHIEVQVFGDEEGNAVHLFERECSVQRRYQKLIEEAPAVSVSAELKEKLYQAALTIAREIHYRGAGTIEFLVDSQENFYFLEMNTRLQVEHPVTEMITGLDLVEWQIKVAAGMGLPLLQEEIAQNGHAIELRVCAENPLDHFHPTSGVIHKVNLPTSDCVRVESFVKEGIELSVNYDSLVAKVIARGEDRGQAIQCLTSIQDDFFLAGIKTNWSFIQQIIKNECFIRNEINTRFIENKLEQFEKELSSERDSAGKLIPVLAYVLHHFAIPDKNPVNLWERIGYWRAYQSLKGTVDGKPFELSFQKNNSSISFQLEGMTVEVDELSEFGGQMNFKVNGKPERAVVIGLPNYTLVELGGHDFELRSNHVPGELVLKSRKGGNAPEGQLNVHADLFGRIVETHVKSGDFVEKGQLLLIVESMKTEFRVLSPADGVVKSVCVEAGDLVQDKQLLVEFEIKNKITINA